MLTPPQDDNLVSISHQWRRPVTLGAGHFRGKRDQTGEMVEAKAGKWRDGGWGVGGAAGLVVIYH